MLFLLSFMVKEKKCRRIKFKKLQLIYGYFIIKLQVFYG